MRPVLWKGCFVQTASFGISRGRNLYQHFHVFQTSAIRIEIALVIGWQREFVSS